MNTITAITMSLLLLTTGVPLAHAETREQCLEKATSAIDRARCNLGNIGERTGLGEATEQPDVGIYEKIAAIINILLGFAGVIAAILIIVAGTRWIMAGGNEEEITKAKNTIRSAVIGIVVVLGAYVLVNFVIGELIGIFTS